MKIKRIKVPIYNYRVAFIDEEDVDVLKKFFAKNNYTWTKEYPYATTLMGSVWEKGFYRYCVYVVFNTKSKHDFITPGVIAHEAAHVAEFIMQHVGWEYDMDNSEPFTYLAQYITDEIHKFLYR